MTCVFGGRSCNVVRHTPPTSVRHITHTMGYNSPMTTINSQDDFLRALEENPQWRDAVRRQILTEELLQLPVRFDTLAQDMSQVKNDINTLSGRIDSNFNTLSGRIDSNFNTLSGRIDSNFNTLSGRIDSNFNTLSGRIDNAVGYNYQAKVERNLRSIAGQYLHLRNIVILRSSARDVSPEFDNLIQEAVDQGLITEEQSYEVWDTDLIFVGTSRGDATPIYVAAEVSITAGDTDITRAVHRAELVSQATRLPVTPVIICANVDDPRQALAARRNVAIIPHPWP